MSDPLLASAPIDRYIRALDRALRGHRRDKQRLLEEVRHGLYDAASAQIERGASPEAAALAAVATFGAVPDVLPPCQEELSVRQVRRTARAVAFIVPTLIAGWHVVWTANPYVHWQPTRAITLLAAHLAGVGVVTAVLGVLTLLLTGRLARWLALPRKLPRVLAVSATLSAVSMTSALLALAAAAPVALTWPVLPFAGVAAAVGLTALARSAWACHRCAVSEVAA